MAGAAAATLCCWDHECEDESGCAEGGGANLWSKVWVLDAVELVLKPPVSVVIAE